MTSTQLTTKTKGRVQELVRPEDSPQLKMTQDKRLVLVGLTSRQAELEAEVKTFHELLPGLKRLAQTVDDLDTLDHFLMRRIEEMQRSLTFDSYSAFQKLKRSFCLALISRITRLHHRQINRTDPVFQGTANAPRSLTPSRGLRGFAYIWAALFRKKAHARVH